MKFAILFEDDPAHSHKRQQYMSDHLAFLKRNASRISAAGPLRNGDDAAPAGGLWIVRADNYHDARALSEEDPLFSSGLRRKITILEWKQVFADGEVLQARADEDPTQPAADNAGPVSILVSRSDKFSLTAPEPLQPRRDRSERSSGIRAGPRALGWPSGPQLKAMVSPTAGTAL